MPFNRQAGSALCSGTALAAALKPDSGIPVANVIVD
jgi:hypothetical protein